MNGRGQGHTQCLPHRAPPTRCAAHLVRHVRHRQGRMEPLPVVETFGAVIAFGAVDICWSALVRVETWSTVT